MPLRQCLHPSRRLLPRDVLSQSQSQVQSQSRLLHTTATRKSNHYEALGLEPSASPGDIKKQFYSLSQKHHPDHNPNDPHASERFMKVSEAYATLGSPEKRKHYDRDLLRTTPTTSSAHARSGSYSSASSPAGARPASGLSRRRSQFRGPPPSFYRNGGWGAYGQKRQAQANEAAQAYARAAAAGSTVGGGMGPGQGQAGFSNDVPHFDQEGHLRTQEQQERRRRRRMRDGALDDYGDGGSLVVRFLLIGGIVSLACSPFIVFGGGPQVSLNQVTKKES